MKNRKNNVRNPIMKLKTVYNQIIKDNKVKTKGDKNENDIKSMSMFNNISICRNKDI